MSKSIQTPLLISEFSYMCPVVHEPKISVLNAKHLLEEYKAVFGFGFLGHFFAFAVKMSLFNKGNSRDVKKVIYSGLMCIGALLWNLQCSLQR